LTKIINWNDVPPEHTDDPDFASAMKTLLLGNAAGSEKLYVNIDFVKPGGKSCKYHAHARSEEFFMILQGNGTLRMDGEEMPVKKGDCISKPAGRGIAHQFINTGEDILQILDCGLRVPDDVITYPDDDTVYVRGTGVFRHGDKWTDWSFDANE
jgi:uncharacterized cupin superfamily protein